MEKSLIQAWNGKTIFVVGDIILDKFVYGKVDRISPEAPIPVLHFKSETYMLGGAANVARNIVGLGGRVLLAGVIGKDEAGEIVSATLANGSGIEDRLVRTHAIPTTIKTRFVSGGQQVLRLDVETKLAPNDKVTEKICEDLNAIISDVGAIVLSDYAKGVLHTEQIQKITKIAQAYNVPVIVDPKRPDVGCYAGATIITPNTGEAAAITHLDCQSDASVEEAARRILALSAAKAIIITRGAQGMTLLCDDGAEGKALHIPTQASEVYDVSGAGDTVVATLALAIAGGGSYAQAAVLANAAAGIVVGKPGTAIVHAQELIESGRRPRDVNDAKIVTLSEASSIVSDWKSAGHRVGFTNGCFDLLHPGHVRLLQHARAECDRLVVAINSDASVKRLKGESRPMQNESARALIMAAIASVDLVLIFEDDTPLALISALLPDILIKGSDYTVATVVGADIVQENGGKVVLVPLEVGHSTTSIISEAAKGGSGLAF